MPGLDDVEAVPVAECTSAEVARALTLSFEGYFVPVDVSAQAYERRFRAEDVDPFASRVFLQGGEPAGIVLVARRGWTSRVAAMGVVARMRGRGLGRRAMELAIDEARARGDRALVLEVIEQNVPARGLYASLGFEARRRLVGYRHRPEGTPSGDASALREIDPLDFARVVAREGDPDLPWSLCPETLSALGAPARAFHLDEGAWALVADPAAEALSLAGLVVARASRRAGCASRLLQALEAAFPGRAWVVSPVVPEGLACAFFQRLGWEPLPLTQLDLRLTLGG